MHRGETQATFAADNETFDCLSLAFKRNCDLKNEEFQMKRRNLGSGKTTLLKLIADRCGGESRGAITLNQRPLRRKVL